MNTQPRSKPEPTRLRLHSAEDQPLVHRFYQQPEEPAGLLVAFPGVHYGVDGPLLYYPTQLLWRLGWDTLSITYGFQSSMSPFSVELIPQLLDECGKAIQAALVQRVYPRIGLVGKSLGAGVVASLCCTELTLAQARAAYLTPTLGLPLFDPIFTQTKQPAYMAIGSEDRYYNADLLAKLQQDHPFRLSLLDRADHSLNVTNDFETSIQHVGRVSREIVAHFTED